MLRAIALRDLSGWIYRQWRRQLDLDVWSEYWNVETGERKTATGPRWIEMSTEKRAPGMEEMQRVGG